MLRDAQKKLTSVRIAPGLWDAFKQRIIETKFSFQKLASRAIWLYLNDEEFKNKIHEVNDRNFK